MKHGRKSIKLKLNVLVKTFEEVQICCIDLVQYRPEVMVRGGNSVFVINQIPSDCLFNKTYSCTWH
jgi:hypothetical protein